MLFRKLPCFWLKSLTANDQSKKIWMTKFHQAGIVLYVTLIQQATSVNCLLVSKPEISKTGSVQYDHNLSTRYGQQIPHRRHWSLSFQ